MIKSTWAVCSDHFESCSYHDTDEYTTRKRLLANAVPTITQFPTNSLKHDDHTRFSSVIDINSVDNNIVQESSNLKTTIINNSNQRLKFSPSMTIKNSNCASELNVLSNIETTEIEKNCVNSELNEIKETTNAECVIEEKRENLKRYVQIERKICEDLK